MMESEPQSSTASESPSAPEPEGLGQLSAEIREAVLAATSHDVAPADAAPVDRPGIASVQRLSGGASRHTWRVAVGSREVIVQQERSGSTGASLSMAAQAALLRAARDVGVPTPRVLGAGGPQGAGFVVLESVEGESLPRRILRDLELSGRRPTLARTAGRILASLHMIAIEDHPELAQVDPLEQMYGLLDFLGEPHPAFELGLRWLTDNRPEPREDVVVHGDFRMGNLLVDDTITAVLDWELAHRGSPVEDLGWFCCRAWRFGSALRAGGVGTVEELLGGYAEGGGDPPSEAELAWWEAYGTLRWGLICVLQASVHLSGQHRSVELAAIGRRAAECEEDLLALVHGPSDYEPPDATDRTAPVGPSDRPTVLELLAEVQEQMVEVREGTDRSTGFHLRVAGNVLAMVGREVALGADLAERRARRLELLDVRDEAELAELVRGGGFDSRPHVVARAVRELVRDKLAVSNPGYWNPDPPWGER